ncbi:hypothetical protein BHE74_00004750 [Ensete ventricosum]|nr:hypothetical protein BHE74_00004750 [Ensete ventricosum]
MVISLSKMLKHRNGSEDPNRRTLPFRKAFPPSATPPRACTGRPEGTSPVGGGSSAPPRPRTGTKPWVASSSPPGGTDVLPKSLQIKQWIYPLFRSSASLSCTMLKASLTRQRDLLRGVPAVLYLYRLNASHHALRLLGALGRRRRSKEAEVRPSLPHLLHPPVVGGRQEVPHM